MEVHTLLPLSRPDWRSPVAGSGCGTADHVLAGCYPEMRLRGSLQRRQAWAKAYIQTLVERDVQDIAHIEHLSRIPQLLNVAAAHCGELFNACPHGAATSWGG